MNCHANKVHVQVANHKIHGVILLAMLFVMCMTIAATLVPSSVLIYFHAHTDTAIISSSAGYSGCLYIHAVRSLSPVLLMCALLKECLHRKP